MNDMSPGAVPPAHHIFWKTTLGTAVLAGLAFGALGCVGLFAVGLRPWPLALLFGAAVGAASGYIGSTAAQKSPLQKIYQGALLGFMLVTIFASDAGNLHWLLAATFILSAIASDLAFQLRAPKAP